MEKKILLIINKFAPPLTGGTIRVYKFAKYLIRKDWKVYILYNGLEKAKILRNELPFKKDLRKAVLIEVPALDERIKRRSEKKKKLKNSDNNKEASRETGYKERLKKIIIPDVWRLIWIPFAVKKARKVMKRERIKYVLTSSPAHSTQIIGLHVKKNFKKDIIWVADFRDLWSNSPTFQERKKRVREINWRLERKIIEQADRVIFNTDGGKELNLKSLNILKNDSIHHVITNGYDEEDFKKFVNEKNASEKYIKVSYVGSIYGPRMNSNYPEAIEMFLKRNQGIEIKFNFIGSCSGAYLERIERINKEKVNILNHVTHEEAIKKMYDADILVAFWNNSKEGEVAVAGKIYEYLRVGKPILAIFPKGDVTRLIEENNLGETANPERTEEIVTAIEKLIANQKKYNKLKKEKLITYERSSLTDKLERLLLEAR